MGYASENGTTSADGLMNVLDWTRLQIAFEDFERMFVFYQILLSTYGTKIRRVKNKHLENPWRGSPSMLLNIEIGTLRGPMIVEAQLYLDKILIQKQMAHLGYNVQRAGDMWDMPFPNFSAH